MKLINIIPVISVLLLSGSSPVHAYSESEQIIDFIESLSLICDKVPLDEPQKYDRCVNQQIERKLRRSLFELESTPN
jgi:hypothetical protein